MDGNEWPRRATPDVQTDVLPGSAGAYILIQTHAGACGDVLTELHLIQGLARVETVGGPYDLVALVEVGRDVDSLLELVCALPGVCRALPCVRLNDDSEDGRRVGAV